MLRTRILQVVASSRGGGATHVRDLALGLDPARFAVQVAMPEDAGNVSRTDFEPAGIPFHRLDIAEGASLRAVQRLRLLAADVDILHAHGARAALFTRLAATSLFRRRRPRVVYTIHGFVAPHYPQPRRAVLLTIERTLAPATDLFIAVSQAEREALLDAGIAPPKRVRVVRNGIDVSRFCNVGVDRSALREHLDVPPDSLLITTVCRLYTPRDFDTLLMAFRHAAAAKPDAHLLIVGDGPWRERVARVIREQALVNRVTMSGSRRDVPEILAASDVFVLTSLGGDGLPLTILEAMAAGLPVVATHCDGIPEAVAEGQTGRLVGRQDAEALAAALIRLADDADLRRQMGEAGQTRAQREFTRERMAHEIELTYAALR